MTDVIIIGAGISGLSAARVLTQHGLRVLLLDKGFKVGGRVATRRFGGATVDHGAQFFTVRSDEFSRVIVQALECGAIKKWTGLGDSDSYPRYCGKSGINDFPRYLLNSIPQSELELRLSTCVSRIQVLGKGWQVHAEDGLNFCAKSLLITCPLPQSLLLLKQVPGLDREQLGILESVVYHSTITILLTGSANQGLPNGLGAMREPCPEIAWIADNRQKGNPGSGYAFTVHCSYEYSKKMLDFDDQIIWEKVQPLLTGLGVSVHPGSQVGKGVQLHRWKYAEPTQILPASFGCLSESPLLLIAGEAFNGPRIEGAYMSGLAAADYLLNASK